MEIKTNHEREEYNTWYKFQMDNNNYNYYDRHLYFIVDKIKKRLPKDRRDLKKLENKDVSNVTNKYWLQWYYDSIIAETAMIKADEDFLRKISNE